jgi:hypothetical protein
LRDDVNPTSDVQKPACAVRQCGLGDSADTSDRDIISPQSKET